ncbi:2-amino-4-hydroxy-6-hydroxymethyldihydropteridine diphosphokinase [Desulfospira joergensenii]|uniref:2-amino-4-hydroxy-6- hydroxymethyldihydropteridine diphosphokinase n=1 Tax=Desulfospira joergensenii TaxID=53329 RepID=UPI0003B7B6F1|nr:2-amino-4-hydroxy-6-hydroxymethyldihydropteridine diphosphokinase [Desulfospira joergensenii]
MSSLTAFLSIGSNKGEKKENLDQAVQCLDQDPFVSVKEVSKFYRTRPQNYADQDWFINAALRIETKADNPFGLLEILKRIESSLDSAGKAFRFGPRKIDLDIVYFENWILKTALLEIPHPRMHERCFVLRPICDIGADTIHPVFKLKTIELLKTIENEKDQEVIPLDPKED